jgi:hypothetical protein
VSGWARRRGNGFRHGHERAGQVWACHGAKGEPFSFLVLESFPAQRMHRVLMLEDVTFPNGKQYRAGQVIEDYEEGIVAWHRMPKRSRRLVAESSDASPAG